VAEKFEAMVRLGITNTRMKDFFDLLILARGFTFDGPVLAAAISATFARRGTPIPESAPLALTTEFADDPGKQAEWQGFLKRSKLTGDTLTLHVVIEEQRAFFLPLVEAFNAGTEFVSRWISGGPWYLPSA
jgi:Nucleotidyl transferase AbiEii toxin, Type IV TA system